MGDHENLSIMLQAAVPLWINQWKKKPWSEVCKQLDEKSKTLPQLLGAKGDILIHGGGEKGEAANLFNQTAEAISLMSFLPGGIEIFGGYWESTHPETEITDK